MYSGYKPLIKYVTCKYFLPLLGYLFTFLMILFKTQKTLIVIKSILSIFNFAICAFGVISKKAFTQGHKGLLLFSSESFIVATLTFRSKTHFKLIFVCGVHVDILLF